MSDALQENENENYNENYNENANYENRNYIENGIGNGNEIYQIENQPYDQNSESNIQYTDQYQTRTTDPNQTTGNYGNEPETVNMEWGEFFDESAQANYWFNNSTGEASWINPYV